MTIERMLLACPACSAVWGMEEIDEQHCGACGYPDDDEDFDYDDYFNPLIND
jgi:Zn ribbon nucleic-acid-binding protein